MHCAAYREINSTKKCMALGSNASKKWYPNNKKKLIINLGYGTTGTRWLHCVMQRLGFKSAHNVNIAGTAAYNRYDYVADSPVPYQAYQLIKTNPDAAFLLSLRDGKTWWRKRLEDHRSHPDQPKPCGNHDLSSKEARSKSPAINIAFEAWVKCLVPSDQLFSFNLWETNDDTFIKSLVQFLERRGYKRRNDFWDVSDSKMSLKTACPHDSGGAKGFGKTNRKGTDRKSTLSKYFSRMRR